MVFRIRADLTSEDREGLAAACRRKAHRVPARAARRLLCLYVTALDIFTLALMMPNYGVWNPAVLFLLLCLGIAWAVIWPWAPAPSSPALPPEWQSASVRAAFFGDGCFVFWNASERTRLGYSALTAVWEDGGRFYLLLRDRPPLVLPKRGLAGGQMPEDFRDFLERESGGPVERIK